MPWTSHLNPCIAHPHWHPRGWSRRRDSTDSNFRGKGGAWVRWPAKKPKKAAIQEVALHRASPPLGVGGGGGVVFSLLQYGPKQEIETLVHEHECSHNCFLKTGHAGRNKVSSFSVVMVSSKYQFTYFGH